MHHELQNLYLFLTSNAQSIRQETVSHDSCPQYLRGNLLLRTPGPVPNKRGEEHGEVVGPGQLVVLLPPPPDDQVDVETKEKCYWNSGRLFSKIEF